MHNNILKYLIITSLLILMSGCTGTQNYKAEQYNTENKTALLVGIGDYQEAVNLKNPEIDAQDFGQTLKQIGFQVITVIDPTKKKLEAAIHEFIIMLNKRGGIGLFYYAGHGSQLEGENYLIPTDFSVKASKSVKSQSVNTTVILDQMGKSRSSTNVIILDACRDNPFEASFQVATRSLNKKRGLQPKQEIPTTGLSKIDAPPNSFIAFSTSPGEVAVDGTGRNSPYVEQLMKSIQKENYTIEQVFQDVRNAVYKQTDGRQVPWESSSLLHSHYFKPIKRVPTGW